LRYGGAGVAVTLMALFGMLALAVSNAQGVVLSGSGLSADVRATITPTGSPTHGRTPMALAVEGTVNPAADGSASLLTAVALRLDRHLQATTAGLATCTSDLTGIYPAQARKRCGDAQVGSGSVTTAYTFAPEVPPMVLSEPVLFFNAAGRSRLLMYRYTPEPLGPASTAATAQGFRIPLGQGGGLPKAFRVRFGKTWTDHGERRSYLSGRCDGGVLSTRVTLTFRSGTLTGSLPTPCTRGS
jgi:hypothetical protein